MKAKKILIYFKELRSPKNIYEACVILRWFLFFCGLMPLYLDTKTGKFRQLKLSYILSISYYIIIAFSYSVTYTRNETIEKFLNNSVMWSPAFIVYSFTTVVCFTSVFIATLCRTKHFRISVEMFMKIDELANSTCININYTNIFNQILKRIIILIIYQIIFTTLSVTVAKEFMDFFYIIAFVFPPFFIWSFALKFSICSYIVKVYIRELNLALKGFEKQDWNAKLLQKRIILKVNIYNSKETIDKLCQIHENICDLIDQMNIFFGIPLFFLIGINFVSMVFNIFFIFDIIFGPHEIGSGQRLQNLILHGLHFISCKLYILNLIESSNLVSKENEKIGMKLFKILNFETCQEIKERLRCFINQWGNRKIYFSAAGIFNIDRTLFFTVSIFFK